MRIFPSLQILTYSVKSNLGDCLSVDCHSRIDMLKRSVSTYSLSTLTACLNERVSKGNAEGQYVLARGSVRTRSKVSMYFNEGQYRLCRGAVRTFCRVSLRYFAAHYTLRSFGFASLRQPDDATACAPYGARPVASGNLTTSSQVHLVAGASRICVEINSRF